MAATTTPDQDPFLQVQADVLTQLAQTRPLFTSYLRIRSLAPSTTTPETAAGTSPELAAARADLEAALQSLADDLADLLASVHAAQHEPARYGLERDEVARRRRLVDEVGGEVEGMREELRGSIMGSSRVPASSSGVDADGDERNDYHREFEQQQQLRLMADQDVQLDGVFRTVGNLRRQADDMGRELEEQTEMLEVVDGLADRVGSRLGTGIKRMGEVVRRNEDGLSSCCIGVLVLVLVLLLVLVLFL
jgi:t-SNARE syntaxin family protein